MCLEVYKNVDLNKIAMIWHDWCTREQKKQERLELKVANLRKKKGWNKKCKLDEMMKDGLTLANVHT